MHTLLYWLIFDWNKKLFLLIIQQCTTHGRPSYGLVMYAGGDIEYNTEIVPQNKPIISEVSWSHYLIVTPYALPTTVTSYPLVLSK